MLGRAGGLASYVLLVALVVTGLVLAHPWSRHWHRPSPRTRLTLHVSLATFTLVFTTLHVVVLAIDPWAKVGWIGAVLPMASEYRPVPVTLGVLALWAGLVTGLTAALAGRLAARVWWPIHKVAAVILVLVWVHSVLAGSDVAALQGFYLATGVRGARARGDPVRRAHPCRPGGRADPRPRGAGRDGRAPLVPTPAPEAADDRHPDLPRGGHLRRGARLLLCDVVLARRGAGRPRAATRASRACADHLDRVGPRPTGHRCSGRPARAVPA